MVILPSGTAFHHLFCQSGIKKLAEVIRGTENLSNFVVSKHGDDAP